MKVYTCFPGFLAKALTMSYDDGKIQDERLVGLFNKYGIKGTFNLNYGIMINEDAASVKHPRLKADKVKNLYEGHEIATHTMTHPTIARVPNVLLAREILDDRAGLERMTGRVIRGHAYPNGSYNENIKQLFSSLGIAYGRVTETTEDFELPNDPMEWRGTCHHNSKRLMELAEIFAEFNKPQYLKLMYVWGHSYEFDDRDNWDVIENFCEYIGGRSDIWYATNIEIIDYMETAKRLQFSADASMVYNPSVAPVYLMADGRQIIAQGGKTTNLL